jgi:hypothetical protein
MIHGSTYIKDFISSNSGNKSDNCKNESKKRNQKSQVEQPAFWPRFELGNSLAEIVGLLVDVVRHSSVPDNVHQLLVQQPSTYSKPEAASAVLGSS